MTPTPNSRTGQPKSAGRANRGFVLITMGAVSIAMIGALGLVVDIGRMFITKNEIQAFADAAALAAAAQLNGQTTGITNAGTAVTNMTSSDKWNFNTASVSSPTVEYATASTGTWTTTPPSPPTGYKFARVTASVSLPIYFIPMVMTSKVYSQNVQAQAVAGQIDLTTLGTGLSPYSAVSTNTTGPNFGLTVGSEYTIQWGATSNNSNCANTNGGINKCFQSNQLCNDDSQAAKWAVHSNWGNTTSGYWGATSASVIESYALGGAQLQAVSVGTNIQPSLTSGQKNSEGTWLDWRVNHDSDSTDTTWANYQAAIANGTANGERLITVPIVNPTSTTNSTVLGYGQFLLETNNQGNYYTKDTTGNDPWCAIYVGTIDLGQIGPGAGSSTGAAQVLLIQ